LAEKINCWQVKGCGREPGGCNTIQFGVCPATICHKLDGIHGGIKAGRSCWVAAGTLCDGKIQGTYASKMTSCKKCDFYQKVMFEEGNSSLPDSFLINKLKI